VYLNRRHTVDRRNHCARSPRRARLITSPRANLLPRAVMLRDRACLIIKQSYFHSLATPRISQFAPDRSIINDTRCLISPLAQNRTITGGPSAGGTIRPRVPIGASLHRIRFGYRDDRDEEEKKGEKKGEKRRESDRFAICVQVLANGNARAEVNRAASYLGFLAGGVQSRREHVARVGAKRASLDFSSGLFISALIFSLSPRSMAPSRLPSSFSLCPSSLDPSSTLAHETFSLNNRSILRILLRDVPHIALLSLYSFLE